MVYLFSSTARQAAPTQTRKKYILQPADEGGKPCPTKLLDIKHCTDLPWCDVYLWEVSEWSVCVPPPRSPFCGQALRGRSEYDYFFHRLGWFGLVLEH